MTGVEEGKGGGGGEGTDVSATDKVGQQNGAPEKAPVVAGTNMETLPRPGKQSDPSTAFLRAARAGQLEKVLEFLETGVDINASNANGLNALHLAAKDGHLEIVRELLTRGATVDAATKKGNTALHIASLAGQEEVVQLLVQKGASVNAQSQNGFTPLYMAAQENHDSVVKFLLSKGANQTLATEDGFTPLAVAMQQGHDKVVAVLLESDTRGKVRLPALHIAAKKDDCKAAALLLQNDHNPDVTSKSGFTPLHIAAHYGNDRIASLLYEKGADVNFAAKHNITPMHVAAKWGKIKMVNLLMSKGANISAKTRDGLTPLHCAARAGHHEVVDILIEKGAPIGSKTKNGLAPLHMASQGDHVDAARILLYHRAPVDEVTVDYLTALHVAAHCGHVRVAKLLLDRNADPNARALNGFTPLHIACKKNRIKVVELLLKHKASIEATTESGLTPLHVASFMGCMNIVIYLLQNEASPDIPTVRGETPLHLAARANQTDIIRILLRNGAQVDARAREEQTPLHVASRLGNVDIVMLLLQHGADVDATTKDLYTPLHIAAKEGQEEVASVLLENGASLTATTKKGFTPLHLAAKYGNMNVARLLLQKNAPVDAQGKNGVTPLHVASHYDHQNVALLLLDKGASPHAMAKNGHTPLHIAARKNQMDIATTLLEYGAKANAESKAGFTPLHLSAQEGHTDMSTLLIEHKADTNHKAKNGLTPLHLCAQEDKTNVATILVKNGAQIDAKTKAGYTPLHVASHFGQAAMVRFLLRNGAAVDSGTGAGYTPLHQAAQQGHTLIINLLLESKAKPNAVTNNGQTALGIAQKLGYISVVETLKVVTETVITTTHTITIEEKYKVQAPESMQETFMSDSEDEGGGDEIGMAAMNVYGQPPHAQHVYLPSYYQGQMTYTREDPMLSDQQQYRYMTGDEMKSMGDDSMRVNVTDDEKDNRHSGGVSVTDMVTKETYQRTNAANLKPDNVDIHRHPVHVGFLVSFLVDARGGAMRGCRHSGVRVIVPPRKAAMPMRVTCRYLKRDKLTNPPPLMEGEALASRILELGPVGAKFLGPVIIEVPHFASLRGKEREIVILRSDNGETWREHTLEASEEAVQDVLNESFEGEELSQLEDLQTSRIVRILTVDFPHYFAVVSRIRQEVHAVGPEGGTVSSSAVPQVQAVFPPAALTKKIRVGLQAHPIPVELVAKLLGNRVAVSPIVTVEPRRRKFHKPITLTIPVPQAANKGMINQYSGETPTLRLLCSITGGQSRAVWEDVTGSTPLQFVKDCVSFTTTVSARFWLMDCRNITEATRMATELYTHATHVPFMAKFVVFAKRVDPLEARLRVFCMTDDKEDKTLEHQEHFTEVAKSRDVEVLEGKTQYMEFAGNLVPVLKSGEQLQLPFRAFKENRVPFTARVKDPDAADMVGRIMYMSEPKVAKGEPPQTPICTLNILLPEKISPDAAHSELDLLELSKNYSFLRDGGISRPDTIHRATIRLTDIANLLDRDWEKLAEEINISAGDVELIKQEHADKPALQAATMFKIWQANGNKATGNTLEKALNKIGREDIVKKCIFNVELVTDDVEKAVARVRLDQPGFDSLKEELGPSRDSSLRRDGTLGDHRTDLDYEEPDRMRDSESIEDLKAVGNVPHKQTKQQHITINGTTVFNGTSTPIKDKYASDEKELVDEMADFLEHKCHKTDTMTKRIRDEADDDNRNRQKIIEDANRLVTGVLQDAEKEKEKLAKEGWSGVYDDTSKEAEGAVGQVEGIIAKESVGRGEESIEPLFIKKKKIDTPHGTVITTVTTTTKGDPKRGTVISETKTIKETITPDQMHLFETKEPGSLSQDSTTKKVTITKTIITLDSDLDDAKTSKRSDEPSAPMAAFDPNVEADRTVELTDDIVRIQPDPVLMSKDRVSENEKLLKGEENVAEKTMKNKLNDDAKDSKTVKPIKETDAGAYEGVYNVHLDDPKAEGGKKKEKGSIFSGIFRGPKTKKGKQRDSKEVSFDSGDEDIKVTKEFLEDTRKVADLTRDSPQFEYPPFDPTTYICICPQKLPENEPKRDPIWATADFLYDSRRSAEAFVPEMEDATEEQEIKPIDGVAITPEIEKIPEKKAETKEGPVGADDHKEKHGFFSGLFKSSKKHDPDVDSPILMTKKEGKNIIAKHEQELQKSVAEGKSNVDDAKDQLDSSLKTVADEVDSAITTTKKSTLDDVKDFQTSISDDKKQTEDRLKGLSADLKSLDVQIKSDAGEIRKEVEHATGVLKTEVEKSTDEIKDKSGGFFGIFKSPKAKNRRSRSKDKDTSKDVSFDSGDEELRVSTAAFLDDTRKAADRAWLDLEKEPQVKEQSDIKVEKFITTVPEESDPPKDKLKGSAYDVKIPKVETVTTTMTTKTIVSKSDPNDETQSSEQKRSSIDKKKKAEQRRSGDFSDSADEGKSKGTSFFDKFKSPKLRSRKKNRSRDRSTSTEPSFDSGDEELRNTTSKFLDDTRKMAEVTSSFDEPRKSLKDTMVTEELTSPVKTEAKQTRDETMDVKSKEDEGKAKGGLFGIFKSPKNHIRRRSKSREKSSSTDASFDSGDEDLRIATSKLLDDTRKIADIMEEHPYPSAPVVESLHRDEDDDKKASQLGEKSGFLSGIFQSAKHAVEEVTDDVKEFWEETKEEAEEEKQQADHQFEKATKTATEIQDGITAGEETIKADIDKKVGEHLDEAVDIQQNMKAEIKNVMDKPDTKIPHHVTKESTEVKGKVSKISKDVDKAKKSIVKPSKKELDVKQGKIAADTKKVAESPITAKRKIGKEPEKSKEKGPGLLSGIIKGAKHAVDEVSEEVKEFWDETKDEAKKEEEERAQKEVEGDLKKISPIKDSDSSTDEQSKKEKVIGKEVTGPLKGIKGKVTQATTTTVKTTRASPPKYGKATDQTKKVTSQPLKEESKIVKRKISDADKTVPSKIKTTKETAGDKTKITKNIPETVKTTKDTAAEKVKPTIQSSAEQVKPSKVSPTEKLKSDKTNGQDKTKPVRQSPPKLAANGDQAKKGISKPVKPESKITKGKVDSTSKTISGAKDTGLKKDKELKKGKDNSSDFLTGIIKSAKNTADEVVEDVNQFLDETRKDAEEQEKQLRQEAKDTTKVAAHIKSKIVQDIDVAKDKVLDTVNEKSNDIVDFAHATDKKATEIIDNVQSESMKDEVSQDRIIEPTTGAADFVEKAAEKAEKETKKAKEKGKGFLFGIFKGGKQSIDETTDGIQDSIDSIKKEGEKGKSAVHAALKDVEGKVDHHVNIMKTDIKKTKDSFDNEIEESKIYIDDKISGAATSIKDDIDTAKGQGGEELEQLKKTMKGALKESSERTDDAISSVHMTATTIVDVAKETSQATDDIAKQAVNNAVKISDAAVKDFEKGFNAANEQLTTTAEDISDSIKDGKEKVEKENKKVKEKGKGFFTNIFKGSKHVAEDTTDNVEKFLEKAKEDATKEKEQLQKDIEKTAEVSEDIKDSIINELHRGHDTGADIAKAADEVISSTTKRATIATKDGTTKVVDEILDTEHTVTEELNKNAEKLKQGVNEAAHNISETADGAKDKLGKESGKAKEKGKGFFSGIFKGVRHISDEAVEDAKDLADKADKSLEEDKQKISQHISDTTKTMSDVTKEAKNNTIHTMVVGKDTVVDTTQAIADTVINTTHQTEEAAENTVNNIVEDVAQTKDSISTAIITDKTKKETESLKEDMKNITHAVVDIADETKDKVDKEAARAKEKTKGFFAGIFKGAKHAADEVVENVNEFIHETEEEAKKEEEIMSKNISHTADNIKDAVEKTEEKVVGTAIAGKDAVVDGVESASKATSSTVEKAKDQLIDTAVAGKDVIVDGTKMTGEAVLRTVGKVEDKIVDTANAGKDMTIAGANAIGDAVSNTTEQTSKKSKDAFQKVSDGLVETKDAITLRMKENLENAQDEINDVGHTIADSTKEGKEKIQKEASKAKDKTKGFFSGIFKGAKHATVEVSENTKDFLDHSKKEIDEDREKLAQQVSQTATTATDAVDKVTNKIMDTAASGKDAVVRSAEHALEKTQDASKKVVDGVADAKNAVNQQVRTDMENLGDVAHTVAETLEKNTDNVEKEALKAKEKTKGFFSGIFKGAKHNADEAAEDTKDFLEHTKKEIQQDKEKLSKQVSDKTEALSGMVEKAKDNLVEISSKSKETVENAAETSADVLSMSAEHALKTSKDAGKAAVDIAHDVTEAAKKQIKTETEHIKDQVQDTAVLATETVEKTKHEVDQEVTQSKEKMKGFFSGIFKGAKHTTDEISEATKGMAKETEMKMGKAEEKVAQDIAHAAETATKTVGRAEDALVETTETSGGAIHDTIKMAGEVISGATEFSSKPKDVTTKIGGSIADTRDIVNQGVSTDITTLKGEAKDAVHDGAELAAETKDKAEKEGTKAKGKSKGFFSGIFKGSKHAIDEVVDDIKEVIHDVEDETKHDKDRISKQISDTSVSMSNAAENLKDKIVDIAGESKHTVGDAAKAAGDSLTSSTKKAKKAAKDTIEKIDEKKVETERAITDKIKKDTENLRDGVDHATHAVTDSAKEIHDKAEREGIKAKDKTKGFFSGIFKSTKHAADEVVDEVKEFIHETEEEAKHDKEKLSKHISEINDRITNVTAPAKDKMSDMDVASKQSIGDTTKASTSGVISSTTEQAPKATTDTIKSISDEITKTNQAITDKVKEKTASLTDDVKHAAHAVVDSAEETKGKAEKEVANAKDKTKGFFSDIFKGAQHVADEVADDVKDFIHVGEEQAKHGEEKLSKQISGTTEAISDTAGKVKDQVINTADSGNRAAVDMIQSTSDTLSSTADKASEVTKKVADDVTKTRDALTEKMKKDKENVKDEVKYIAATIAGSVQESKDMVEEDAAKVKEKTQGFFSDIFKEAQHVTDDVAKETKDLINESGNKMMETEQKAVKKISDITTTITDTAVKAQDHVVDTATAGKDAVIDATKSTGKVLSSSADQVSKTTIDVTKKINDNIKDTTEDIREELKKDVGTLKDVVKDTAHTLDKTSEETQDKAGKEVKKVKDKTKGFFSGIFKGTKHAADEVVDDVKEFIHETEKEAQEEEKKARKLVAETMKDTNKAINESTITVSKGLEIIDKSEGMKDDTQGEVKKPEKKASDAIKTADGTLPDAASNALHATKDAGHKVGSELSLVKDTVHQGINANAGIAEGKIAETTEKAATAKNKIEKKTKKSKEKSKGMFSGIFKGTKHSSESEESSEESTREIEKEAGKVTKIIDKTVDDLNATKNEIIQKTSEATKAVGDKTQDIIAEQQKQILDIPTKVQVVSSEATEKAKEEIDETGRHISGELDRGLHLIEEAGTNTMKTTSEKAGSAKEKGKGFFSGILKGAKHAVDEVAADIDEFKTKTQKEAEKEDEAARQALNNSAKSVKSAKNKIVTDIQTKKNEVDEQASDTVQRVKEAFVATEADLNKKLSSGDQKISKTAEVISDTASKSMQAGKDVSEKVYNKAHEVKDGLDKQLKDDSKIVKQAVSDFTDTIADTAEALDHKMEAETQKTKDKTKGFFSGLFKSGKQEVDETVQETRDFIDKGTEDLKQHTEATVKSVVDAYDKAAMDIQSGQDQIVQQVSQTTHNISNVAEGLAKDISDSSRGIKNEFDSDVKSLTDETHKAYDKVAKDTSKVSGQIINDLYDTKEAVVTETDNNLAVAKHKIDEAVQSATATADAGKQDIEKTTKKIKEKGDGFFSGIVKGAKHALEEVTDDVKEFWDETKDEAEEEHAKHKVVEADKSVKHDLDMLGRVTQMEDDENLHFKDLETDITKEETEDTAKAGKQKEKSGPIFGILRRGKHDKDDRDEQMGVGNVTVQGIDTASKSPLKNVEKDVKVLEKKIIDQNEGGVDSCVVVKDQAEKDVKKPKEKSSNFFSEIIKGAKHAVEDVSDDVKEFWDESKQSVKEDNKQIQQEVTKTEKHREPREDNSLSSQPSAQTASPMQDPYSATLAFLEDSRETARQIDDRLPTASMAMESSREEKISKGKSKGVISSMVKGTKKATEKFWEETKPEFAYESGSYDVSSPQHKTDKKSEIVDDAQVTLESFGPIESRILKTRTVTKSVSGIPKKIDPTKDFDTEVRVVRTDKSLEQELDDSNRVKGVGHLEPHARQTVTTIVTKSSMRTTMSTPPPSPDELGDSRIKDVTEEAVKRAQSLADQAHELDKSESDFMQQSEPSYVETTTTEIDPVTNERITRTTRVITSSGSTGEAAGSDELRESMQKIVDQFMTEERRGQ